MLTASLSKQTYQYYKIQYCTKVIFLLYVLVKLNAKVKKKIKQLILFEGWPNIQSESELKYHNTICKQTQLVYR